MQKDLAFSSQSTQLRRMLIKKQDHRHRVQDKRTRRGKLFVDQYQKVNKQGIQQNIGADEYKIHHFRGKDVPRLPQNVEHGKAEHHVAHGKERDVYDGQKQLQKQNDADGVPPGRGKCCIYTCGS